MAFTFVEASDLDEQQITYAELDRRARAIAATLQQRFPEGERAVLLYPPGLDYIAAFLGCAYAKLVAVPAYPPDIGRLNRSLPRLQAIVANARAGDPHERDDQGHGGCPRRAGVRARRPPLAGD